jgi:Zn finger protein HypA/HybF involved in hydrogenase expression
MSESLKLSISTPFRSFGTKGRFPDSVFGAGNAAKATYVDALVAEIEGAALDAQDMLVDEVEFVNGPASSLTTEQLERIMRAVRRNYRLAEGALIHATEVPGGLSVDYAGFCKNNHVEYLEIELLSADAMALRAEKLPPANDACVACYQVAYFTGAPKLGILLDAGLDKGERAFRASISQALGRSPLFVRVVGVMGEDADARLKILQEMCSKHGMHQVDAGTLSATGTVVFGADGFAGMPGTHANQIGCGLGAVSAFDGVRFKTTGDLAIYAAKSADFASIAHQL